MKKTYKRINLNERVIIETLLHEKKTKSYISKHLKRAPSTITNELKNWLLKPTDTYRYLQCTTCTLVRYGSQFNQKNTRQNKHSQKT